MKSNSKCDIKPDPSIDNLETQKYNAPDLLPRKSILAFVSFLSLFHLPMLGAQMKLAFVKVSYNS